MLGKMHRDVLCPLFALLYFLVNLCALYACMLDITTFILDFILKSFYWLVRALFEILPTHAYFT